MSLNHVVPSSAQRVDAEFKDLTCETLTVTQPSGTILDIVPGVYDALDVTGISVIRAFTSLNADVNNLAGGVDGQQITVFGIGQSNASQITFNHLASTGSPGEQLVFCSTEAPVSLPVNPLAIPRNAVGLLTYLEATGVWYLNQIG